MNGHTGLHVAIIPDGNRRWAKERGLAPWKGHEKSGETFENLLDWCGEDGRISVLTIWVFSTENWKRDPKEVDQLMKMFEKFLTKKRLRLQEGNIRLVHSGRSDRLSSSLASLLNDVIAETADNDSFTLNVALDYGGKDEVIRAINQTIKQSNNQTMTEEDIAQHLDHPELPDIDLIIRTSGEQRTSNFALWQSTYAEWLFLDTLFPDFGPDALSHALDQYEQRQRRFGA